MIRNVVSPTADNARRDVFSQAVDLFDSIVQLDEPSVYTDKKLLKGTTVQGEDERRRTDVRKATT